MTGGRAAHPLLISLANIDFAIRSKASNRLFLLLALLPIPVFIDRDAKIWGILDARLLHECLDFITQPLKKAAEIGVMMSDPAGSLRYCFTPLVAYIADTPEAATVAGVAGKTSHVTMASYLEFGDPYRHPPRMAISTLSQLVFIESSGVAPGNVKAYALKVLELFRLNGVHEPFWRNWPLAEPDVFLTPEPLHHWHKQFWDHDVKWCIRALTGPEIDFRFSVLHPTTGYRQFPEGIASLKQVTGREHRDIERYLVGVVADAVPCPFLIAIRALMDFRYLAQAPQISEAECTKIEQSLALFHKHKQAILDAGARCGKKNKPINNWHILKLELFQTVALSIRNCGAPIQWSADVTERAHISEIKIPSQASNNQKYEAQIARHLDCAEKCRRFDLATSLQDPDDRQAVNEVMEQIVGVSDQAQSSSGSSISRLVGFTPSQVNYFALAAALRKGEVPSAPLPYRTFAVRDAAFHLTRDPAYRRVTIRDAAKLYNLPDLPAALAHYVHRAASGHLHHTVGGRRLLAPNAGLPFDAVDIWTAMQVQGKEHHYPHDPLPPQTINAAPASASPSWQHGLHDPVVVSIDPSSQWPSDSLKGKLSTLYLNLEPDLDLGHIIAQLQVIMRIVPTRETPLLLQENPFIAYVYRFDVVPQSSQATRATGQYPESATSLYVLCRARRADNSLLGDAIPLHQLRGLVSLIPRFGAKADSRLTPTNSLAYSNEFWLNKYFNKELFYALQ